MKLSIKQLKKVIKEETDIMAEGRERLGRAADDIAAAMELLKSAEEALDMEGAMSAMDAVSEATAMLNTALEEIEEFVGVDEDDED